MENLTKENFWNEMNTKYPNSTKEFCDWIDKYKHKNNWDNLFNGTIEIHDDKRLISTQPKRTFAPKFHDLPLAMQYGIWQQFIEEKGYAQKGFSTELLKDVRHTIQMFLKWHEVQNREELRKQGFGTNQGKA